MVFGDDFIVFVVQQRVNLKWIKWHPAIHKGLNLLIRKLC